MTMMRQRFVCLLPELLVMDECLFIPEVVVLCRSMWGIALLGSNGGTGKLS